MDRKNTQLRPQEIKALNFFYWFTLFFLGLCLLFIPSFETASFAIFIISLGLPLFKNSINKAENKENESPENLNNITGDWSNLSVEVSFHSWLFLIVCSIALPMFFSKSSSTGTEGINLFLWAGEGAMLGLIALMLYKLCTAKKK